MITSRVPPDTRTVLRAVLDRPVHFGWMGMGFEVLRLGRQDLRTINGKMTSRLGSAMYCVMGDEI